MVVRPLITEKSTHLSERHNAYTFEVNPLVGRVKLHGEDGRVLDLSADKFERADGRWRLREGSVKDSEAGGAGEKK